MAHNSSVSHGFRFICPLEQERREKYWNGQVIGKIGKIIALDPAGPHFDYSEQLRNGQMTQEDLEQIALWRTDADFVQVIHTNGNKGGDEVVGGNNIKLGLSRSVGHVDFFPSRTTEHPGSRQLNQGHHFIRKSP